MLALVFCSVSEKPSVKKTKATPAVDPGRPYAPVFLRGLEDLKVMDGSQVTMTVEVAGTCLFHVASDLNSH